MSVIIWQIFTFGAIGIFIVLIILRISTIKRLPLHLRWELAPIPGKNSKDKYGGSYLEDYEWWDKKQHSSYLAPLIYMLKEIILLRGVWKHNKALWPLTISLHLGIYIIFGMAILCMLNAIFIANNIPVNIVSVFYIMATTFAFAGYLLGTLGSVGLIIKRILDTNLREFTTLFRYINLLFLAVVFISGFYALLFSTNFIYEIDNFLVNLFTSNSSITIPVPLSVHIIISLLFVLYLPLTDMVHFFAKYFLYHEVRWNDKPLDRKMEKELGLLMAQPLDWSAIHVKAREGDDGMILPLEKANNEKES